MENKDKPQPLHPVLQQLKDVDVHLSNKCYLSATKSSPLGFLRPYLKFLEISCHFIPWLGGCLIMLWFASENATKAFTINLIIALLIDIIMVAVVKASARRKRPAANSKDMFFTMSVDKLSFPSGHVTRSVLLWQLFGYHFSMPLLISLFVKVWCISVCISRVLLGRHHVGDVLGGFIQGIVEFYIVNIFWLDESYAIGLVELFTTHDEL